MFQIKIENTEFEVVVASEVHMAADSPVVLKFLNVLRELTERVPLDSYDVTKSGDEWDTVIQAKDGRQYVNKTAVVDGQIYYEVDALPFTSRDGLVAIVAIGGVIGTMIQAYGLNAIVAKWE